MASTPVPNSIILQSISNSSISTLMENKLPTNLNILQVLFYKTKNEKIKTDDAFNSIFLQLESMWNNAFIKIKRVDKCKEKFKKLYDGFRSVQKLKNKSIPKVNVFVEELNNVFDISHDNTISFFGSMDIEIKKAFLSKPIDEIKNIIEKFDSQNKSGK